MKLKTLQLGSILFASAMLGATAVHAADYPDHALSLMVPFPAGGPSDNVARSLGEAMRPTLGQAIVIENKGGAGGTIGTSQVAQAKPDGYNILLMHIGFSTAPSLYKKPNYDPYTSFEPIGMVGEVPMTLIARSDFPPNNMQELVAYLKENQDSVSMANSGIGSASHLCGIMLTNMLGIDLLTIPYKGTGPAMNDLLGKQVDIVCDQAANTTQQIQAGTVKAYAITSNERVSTLPDLPTMKESGLEDFELSVWYGLWAPKGTPKPVTDKLTEALQAGVASKDFQQRMTNLSATVQPKDANAQALTKKVEQQVPQWAELFKKVGVQPQ